MTTEDDAEREFTRALFADPERGADAALFGLVDPRQPAPEPDRKRGNYVPSEGRTPERGGGDWAYREWVNDLFGYSGQMP